jgi:two-component system OmpR family sensor kinase
MIKLVEEDLDVETHLAVLEAVAEDMPESIMVTDASEHSTNPSIVYVNPAFTRLTGYTRAEAVGGTPKLLQGGRTDRKVLNQLKRELHDRQMWKGSTYNYTKSGQPFLMEWEIVPIHDTAGNLRFYLTIQRRADQGEASFRKRAALLRRWSERRV